jgi:hypothetical protein
MREGGADLLRQACREGHLVCPVLDCPDPRYVAKGGSRRHHFAHHGGTGGHSPESFYHEVGKQLLAARIRKRQPRAEVTIEGRVENGQVADVLVRSPTGKRYAFEVQYSPLTIEDWQARHEGYRECDITDVWLFGHTPPHLRPAPGASTGFVALTPLIVEFFRRRLPVMFLNPDEEGVVATALLQVHLNALLSNDELREDLPASVPERAAALSVDPLSFCEPYGLGLLTPTGDRLRTVCARQTPTMARRAELQLEAALAPILEGAPQVEELREWEEREREREAGERRARLAEVKGAMATEDPEAAVRWRTLQRTVGRV